MYGNVCFVDFCVCIMVGWFIQERWIENAMWFLLVYEEVECCWGMVLLVVVVSVWFDELFFF